MTNQAATIVPEIPALETPARPLPIANRVQALQALAIQREGHKGAAAGRALGVSTIDANWLASTGHAIKHIEECGLTEPERQLVRAVALETLWLLGRNQPRSPNAADLGHWAGKSKSWAASVARKRFTAEDCPDHLRLIWKAGGSNGHIALTALGWTVALAMISDEDIAKVQPK